MSSSEASTSLESFLSDASPPAKVPKLEISSLASDGSPPAKVLKLDISSSKASPLKGKSLIHEVGIETDSKKLTDHSSVTLDSEDDDYDEDGYEREISDSQIRVYLDAVKASGGFEVPHFPNVNACGMIIPMEPLGDETRRKLEPYCLQALNYFYDEEHKKYEFVKLEKANVEVVGGLNYYLTFEAYNPEDATNQTFQAVIFDGFPEKKGDPGLKVSYCKPKGMAVWK